LAAFEPTTSEDWIQEDVADAFRSLSISTADDILPQRFPRVDGKDEDSVQTELESQLAGDSDMTKPAPEGLTQPLPQRIKRKSMIFSDSFDLDSDITAVDAAPRSTGLCPSSLLCQPFYPSPEPALKFKPFSGKREAIHDPEFTFNVGLPHACGTLVEDVPFDRSWIPPPGVIIGYS